MPNLTSEIQSLIPFLIFLAIFLFLMGIIQLFRQKATARDFIKKIQLAGRDSDRRHRAGFGQRLCRF